MIFCLPVQLIKTIRSFLVILSLMMITFHAASNPFRLDSLLTHEEKLWLAQNKTAIRFSSDPAWPPSIYIENGQLKGFITDYLNLFEQQLGVQLQWVHYQTWQEVLDALKKKEIDFIPGIQKTDQRQQHFLFSDSFEEIELGILVQKSHEGKLKNYNRFKNHRLVSVNDYASNEYLEKIFPEATITYADDYNEAILEAAYGLADGVVIDFITADFLLRKFGISNLVYGQRLGFSWDIMFAVHADNPVLLSIINKFLSTIPETQRDEIFKTWVANELKHPHFFEANKKILFYISGCLFLLMGLGILFIYSLRKKVDKRTKELQSATDLATENEKKYRLIAENTTDVVWLADMDLNVTYISPSVEKMLGWSVDEYLKLTMSDRHPPHTIQQVNAILEEELRKEDDPECDKNRSRHLEIQHYKKNGTLLWIELNVSFLRDKEGRIIGIHGITRDFSFHKKSNEFIQNRLALEKMLTQLSRMAISNVNYNKIFRYILKKAGINLKLSHAYIYTLDTNTRTFHNLNYWCRECEKEFPEPGPIHKQIRSEWLREKLETGNIIKYKSCDRIPDEEIRALFLKNSVLSLLIVPLFLKNKLIGFIGFDDCHTYRNWQKEAVRVLQLLAYIVTSLIERFNREQELMIKDQSIELSTIGAAFTNLDGYITYGNPTFLKYWRFDSLNEVLNKNVRDLWASKKELNNILLALQKKGRWKGEMTATRSDGTTFIAEVDSNTIRDSKGKPICWQASFIDITERKKWENDLIKAKEKAEESNRLKTAFLSNMSHEIRTPMNGILGFLNLLKDVIIPTHEYREYIDLVNKNGKRLLDTVNDIIEIAKIEAGESEIQEDEINLSETINILHNKYTREAQEKNLVLILDENHDTNRLSILTDAAKLDSILSNLIKNAIKFTESGEIHLGVFINNQKVYFYVKDTGPGIPEEYQEVIFNRFIQADMSYSRRHEGSGLGLSISKAYAELLGGKLWVDSKTREGSTFTFYIPLKQAKIQTEHPAFETEGENETLEGHKVLIAEDDYISYKFLETVLSDYGIEIIHVSTGDAAIATLKKTPDVSLVLMDIKMPGMNGIEATRKIREINIQVPVIAQTALAVSNERRKALAAGCNDFITKPIDKNLLLKKITHYIL